MCGSVCSSSRVIRWRFVEKGGEITLQPLSRSLRDLRGSVSVDEPQDFDAVREAVKMNRLESKDD